jgi:hypothetical protein
LVEFAYNNGYQDSLKMIPFEAFYGSKCDTPISRDNSADRVVLRPKLLNDMEDQVVKIQKNLKATQDRQRVYVDKNKIAREFKVGEHVLLKVKPKKIFVKLGSCTKMATRFCCPFEILDRIGPVAYMITLPNSMNVHNIFHFSLLNKYVHNPNHVIDWRLIQV